MKISIDIVSDVVCPWCYVGKRRLEQGMAAMKGRAEFDVRWLPFELNPKMPAAGMERNAYRAAKFGSLEHSHELDTRMTEVGRPVGITFALDRLQRTPNTLDAHRIIRLAHTAGRQDAVVEAFFSAYFTQGIDLTNRKDLLDIAASAGMDRPNLEALLTGAACIAEVRADEEAAYARHIEGVPHFTIARSSELRGAQPPEAFVEVFERVLSGDAPPPSPTNTRFIRP